jgi:hypothetical protein
VPERPSGRPNQPKPQGNTTATGTKLLFREGQSVCDKRGNIGTVVRDVRHGAKEVEVLWEWGDTDSEPTAEIKAIATE